MNRYIESMRLVLEKYNNKSQQIKQDMESNLKLYQSAYAEAENSKLQKQLKQDKIAAQKELTDIQNSCARDLFRWSMPKVSSMKSDDYFLLQSNTLTSQQEQAVFAQHKNDIAFINLMNTKNEESGNLSTRYATADGTHRSSI